MNSKAPENVASMSQQDTESTSTEADTISKIMGQLNIGEPSSSFWRKPVIIIMVGMAGSGKTTFLHRLVCHTMASNIWGSVINLDPAVMTLPYGANIDIRDTVRYKGVMKQFNLGPNGGILTLLNLFSTKFDELVAASRFQQINHPCPHSVAADVDLAAAAIIRTCSGDIDLETLAL